MSESISKNQDTILRGADQQQTTFRTRNLLYEGPQERLLSHRGLGASTTWPTQVNEAVQTVTTQGQPGLRIQRYTLENRVTTNTISMGLGFRLSNRVWEAGDYEVGVAYTKIDNYQSRTEVTWAADFTEGNNDHLVILSRKKFNWVSANNTRASTGNLTTVMTYSDEAGTALITQTAGQSLQDSFTSAGGDIANGENVFVWNPPHDWGKITTSGTLFNEGFPEGYYALTIQFTGVAGTNDPGWTGIEIGTLHGVTEEVATNGIYEEDNINFMDFDADGVVAYFEEAATGNNCNFEVAPAG